MSFYCYKNADDSACPGRLTPDGLSQLRERTCIQTKRVYDSCMKQCRFEDIPLTLQSAPDCGCVAPYTFQSARSTQAKGRVCNLCIDPLPEREHFARVRCTVEIPVEVIYTDACGRTCCGESAICIPHDVILYVPDASVIPYSLDAIASAVCVSGCARCDNTFLVTACVTTILKITAEVELIVPSFGFCQIPPCEEYSENLCDAVFSLPLFPPTHTCC